MKRPLRSLLRRHLVAAVLLGAVLAPFPAEAAAPTGSITGRVLRSDDGTFLANARIIVEGTEIEAVTSDFGEFELKGVAAGAATLRFTYLGLPSTTAAVSVEPGRTVTRDFTVGPAETPAVRVMGRFVVEADRFRNAQQIAINEERHSVNIKNVVAADAFGDIPEGNIGEFIKFLPGVEVSYGGTYSSEADATGISVRGFGPEDTAITIDGVPVSSASPASLSRAIGLDMLSINNASRVELVKVPSPDMPSNSIGGQINLISKSAFEHARPAFNWRFYLSMNSEDPSLLRKVGGPSNRKVHATRPGGEITYIRPVNRDFGLTVSAASSNQFNENRRFRPEFSTTSVTNVDLRPLGGANAATLTNAQGPASLVNPYLTRISVTDAPRTSSRHSGSIKADWRPFAGLALASSYQVSVYDSADAARRLQFRIQRPQSWDARSAISYPFVQAAQSANGAQFTPNSTLDMNIDSRDKTGITHTAYLRAQFRRGPWDILALASVSTSRGSYRDTENGHFSTVDVSANIGRLAFEDLADGIPGRVTVQDRLGAPFNHATLANWVAPTIQARSGKAESLNDEFTYKLDVRRDLDFLPRTLARLSAKAGFHRQESLAKKWGLGTGYRQTYTGAPLTSSAMLDTTYSGNAPGFGFGPQEWISTYRLFDVYAANPALFNASSDSDQVNNWNSYVNQNKRITDTADSWYAMIDGRAFGNRLSFVAGVRQEQSRRRGQGPLTDSKWNFLKLANGELYRDAANPNGVRIDLASSPLFAGTPAGTALRSALTAARIPFPERTVLNTTLEGRRLQLKPLQPVNARSDGDPSYSLNTAYTVTEQLVAKAAWSRTFGRISLEDGTAGLLSGNGAYVINEAETAGAVPAGTIAVANPSLKPWASSNWDFAVTWYTRTGGKVGASYYLKRVSNFQESVTITGSDPNFAGVLESLGLAAADYQDWNLTTSVNGVGTARTTGWEIDVSQDLHFIPLLGDWGRRFQTFLTYSRRNRSENGTTRLTARPSADGTASGGMQFAAGRFHALLKATWSDLKFESNAATVTYNGASYVIGTYVPSLTKVDASLNWQLSPRYTLFASGRDVLNRGSRKERFDLAGLYPAYAHWDDLRRFGVQVTAGVRGSF